MSDAKKNSTDTTNKFSVKAAFFAVMGAIVLMLIAYVASIMNERSAEQKIEASGFEAIELQSEKIIITVNFERGIEIEAGYKITFVVVPPHDGSG